MRGHTANGTLDCLEKRGEPNEYQAQIVFLSNTRVFFLVGCDMCLRTTPNLSVSHLGGKMLF